MFKEDEVISRLEEKQGQDFEKAVKAAFDFLGFECEWKGEIPASPDVIVKAPLADKPFVAILECCAVGERNKVGHGKVSQLRDYYPTYQVEYGREGWSLVYPLLIGKPDFSDECRRYADVGNASTSSHTKIRLIPVAVLCDLIRNHSTFQFSQDELKPIFGFDGPISSVKTSIFDLNKIYASSTRKIRIYALILMGLVNNPIGRDYDPRLEWISLDELYGTINIYALIVYGTRFRQEELLEAVRDLSSPVAKAVEMGLREGRYFVKRTVLSNLKFGKYMGRLETPFVNETLNIMAKLSQTRETTRANE